MQFSESLIGSAGGRGSSGFGFLVYKGELRRSLDFLKGKTSVWLGLGSIRRTVTERLSRSAQTGVRALGGIFDIGECAGRGSVEAESWRLSIGQPFHPHAKIEGCEE